MLRDGYAVSPAAEPPEQIQNGTRKISNRAQEIFRKFLGREVTKMLFDKRVW